MGNKFFAVFGVAAALTLAACASNEANKSSNGNSPGANATVTTATSSNSANSNANGFVAAPQVADANVNDETVAADLQTPQMQNRLNKLRKAGDGPSGPPVDAAALAMKMARPAPDNSTFTSYLSDAGYEIRTFQNHPQLKKVEKRTIDNGTSAIKVFLRSGKVIELPGTAVPILSSAPAILIMDAAGLTAAPAGPARSNPKKADQ